VVAEGTGVLNNSMTGFLGGVDRAEGNKFRATAIAPTIVVKDGLPILALGAGGSESIYRSIPEVISDMLHFGMDVAHAVDAERFDGYQDPKKGP
jgi:gamma-glutamyltranspeptidase / glutathione hydrolase